MSGGVGEERACQDQHLVSGGEVLVVRARSVVGLRACLRSMALYRLGPTTPARQRVRAVKESPMLCALTVRKLKPGTFEEFRTKFGPPGEDDGRPPEGWSAFHMLRSTADENEVVT